MSMVLRLVLGALYVAMALGQALSWSRLPEILDAYQVPGTGSHTFAVTLLAAELVCGLWLLTRPRSRARAPGWIFIAVTVVWTGLAAQGLLRGLEVANCGCFGIYLTQRLSWLVLAEDALLLGYGYVMLRRTAAPDPGRPVVADGAAGRRSTAA